VYKVMLDHAIMKGYQRDLVGDSALRMGDSHVCLRSSRHGSCADQSNPSVAFTSTFVVSHLN